MHSCIIPAIYRLVIVKCSFLRNSFITKLIYSFFYLFLRVPKYIVPQQTPLTLFFSNCLSEGYVKACKSLIEIFLLFPIKDSASLLPKRMLFLIFLSFLLDHDGKTYQPRSNQPFTPHMIKGIFNLVAT